MLQVSSSANAPLKIEVRVIIATSDITKFHRPFPNIVIGYKFGFRLLVPGQKNDYYLPLGIRVNVFLLTLINERKIAVTNFTFENNIHFGIMELI
jgi:hypothetical protein